LGLKTNFNLGQSPGCHKTITQSNIRKAERKLLKQLTTGTKNISLRVPKKNKRKRNMKAAAFGVSNFKTVDQIQKRLLARVNQAPKALHPYTASRMNPFLANSNMGVPDGTNSNFICSDSLAYNDIQCITNAGFVIQTLPCLPASAGISGLGTAGAYDIQIDGSTYFNTANYNANFYPISVLPSYYPTSYVPGVVVNDPYNSAAARLVAVGYKLTYTGQSALCSGTITVTPNNAGFASGPQVTSLLTGTGQITVQQNNATQLGLGNQPIGMQILSLDIATFPNAYTKDSVVFRPEEGLLVLPRHRTKDYKLMPTVDNCYAAVAEQATTGFAGNKSTYFTTDGVGQRNVIWYDQDWSSVQIVVRGIQPGATFRWETAWCMEYTLPGSSPFMQFAEKASKDLPAVINKTEKMISKIPIAQSRINSGRMNTVGFD
jgi:hypothetical protein